MPSQTEVQLSFMAAPVERDPIKQRINDAENQENHVHRSCRDDAESGIAVLTQLNGAGVLVVDRYAEAAQVSQSALHGLEDRAADDPTTNAAKVTTTIIETAQDLAEASLLTLEDFRSLQKRSPALSLEALDELCKLPDSPDVPITTDGFEVGAQSLSLPAQKDVNTFRSYALAKIIGMHAGNCDADLHEKMYDAIRLKENALYKDRRIDDSGRPIKPDGSTYGHLQAQIQVMSAWFVQSMFSIDRVVGRYVGKKLVRHPDKPAKLGEKTIRVDVYLVLEEEIGEESKLDVNGRNAAKSIRRKAIKERARSDDEADLEV